MIETWQYVALIGIVAAVVAVLSYRGRGMADRENAFLSELETTVTNVLAAHQFVLTHEPTRRTVGNYWQFDRASRAVRVYYDVRDQQIIVELREGQRPSLIHKSIATFSLPVGAPPEQYQRVLNGVLEAINNALQDDGWTT